MWQQAIDIFTSAFHFPGLNGWLILLAIALGIVFGAVWLAPYMPPLMKKRGLWVVGITSAFLTWIALAFIQVPLQHWTGQVLVHFWSQDSLMKWLLIAGIPQILLSGLVQEAAKLVPVVFYWWRHKWKFSLKFGLIVGAMAGAGFGIFEAVWVHNTIFASGWDWSIVEVSGFNALLGFWERFFTVGFHTAVSALAGYGLAKGKVWQFYLIAALLHGIANYSIVLLQKGILTSFQTELYVAGIAVAISAVAIWLRLRGMKQGQIRVEASDNDGTKS